MRSFEKKALKKIADEIHFRFGEEAKLYAFGSRVRGDNTGGSDFDLLVVIKNRNPDKEEQIIDIIVDIEMAEGCSFTPVIKDSRSFEQEKQYNTPFYQNIMIEGIEL
ncbi:MAG TPA: nucleotidyltransferase domain-containing protein [Spirochaetota bacterium]|nr:nucleotidyltransferase domain-containing protein [Spirochaetota bacterium]HPI88894.1 nucleotidyltransferase domain-containing protein [Spirochaetota bacterium]HPR46976.1 nucleotidyltransferase domain-containing protein [Spirochaetota bacterium]